MSSTISPPLPKKEEKKSKSTKQVEFNLDRHEEEKKVPPSRYTLNHHLSPAQSGKKGGKSKSPTSKKKGEGQATIGWKQLEEEDFHGPSAFSLPSVLSPGDGKVMVPPPSSILKEKTAKTQEPPPPPARAITSAAVASEQNESPTEEQKMAPPLRSVVSSGPTSLLSQNFGSRTGVPSCPCSHSVAGEGEPKEGEVKGDNPSLLPLPTLSTSAPVGVAEEPPLLAYRHSTDTGGSGDPASVVEWDASAHRGIMRCLDSGNLPSAIGDEEVAKDYYHQLLKRSASMDAGWGVVRAGSSSSRGSGDSGRKMTGPHEGYRGVGVVDTGRHTHDEHDRHRSRKRTSSRKGTHKTSRSPKRRLAARKSGKKKRSASSRKRSRSTKAHNRKGHPSRQSHSKSSSGVRSRSLSGSIRARKKEKPALKRRHRRTSSPPAPLPSARGASSPAGFRSPSDLPLASLAPHMHLLYQWDSPLANAAERLASHFPSTMTSSPHAHYTSPQALHLRIPLATGGLREEVDAPRRVWTPQVLQESHFNPALLENDAVPFNEEEEEGPHRHVKDVCHAPLSSSSAPMVARGDEEDGEGGLPFSEEDARWQGRASTPSHGARHPPASTAAEAVGTPADSHSGPLKGDAKDVLPTHSRLPSMPSGEQEKERVSPRQPLPFTPGEAPNRGPPPPSSYMTTVKGSAPASAAFPSSPKAHTGPPGVSDGSVEGRRRGSLSDPSPERTRGSSSSERKERETHSSDVHEPHRHAPPQAGKGESSARWTKVGFHANGIRAEESFARSTTRSSALPVPSRPAKGSNAQRKSLGSEKRTARRSGVNITEICLRKINPLSYASVKDRKKKQKAMMAEVLRAYDEGLGMFEAEYVSELSRLEKQFREASFEPQSREILRLVEGIQFVRMDCHQKLGIAEVVVNTLTAAMEKLITAVHEKGCTILARDETLLEDKVLDGTPSSVDHAEGVPLPEVQGVLERFLQPRYAPSRTMVLPGETKQAVENFFGKELQFIHENRLELTKSLVVPFFDDPVLHTETAAEEEVSTVEKRSHSVASEVQTSVGPRRETSSSFSYSASPPRRGRESVARMRSGKTRKAVQSQKEKYSDGKKGGGRNEKGSKKVVRKKRASTRSHESKNRSRESTKSSTRSTVKQGRSASFKKESSRGRRRSRSSTRTKSGSTVRRHSSRTKKRSTSSFSSKKKTSGTKKKTTVTPPTKHASSLRTRPNLPEPSADRIFRAKSLQEGEKAKEESVKNGRRRSRTSSATSTGTSSTGSRKRKKGVPATSLVAPKKKLVFVNPADSKRAGAQTCVTPPPLFPTGRETRKSFSDTASKYANELRAYSVFTNEQTENIEKEMTLLTEAMEHLMSHVASRHDLYRRKILAQQRLLDETASHRKMATDVLQSQKDSEALGIELITEARTLGEELRGRMDQAEKEMRETIQKALDDSAVVSMEQLAYRDPNDVEKKRSQVMRHVVCRMERSMLDQAEIMRDVQYVITEMWSKSHPKGREEHNTFLHRSLPTPYENMLQRCGRDTLIRLLHHLSLKNDDALRLLIGALDEREHFLLTNTAEAQAEREDEATLTAVKALLSKMYTEGRIHSNPNKTGSTLTETVQCMVEQFNAFMSFTENYARALLRRDRKRLGKYTSVPLFHPESALPEVLHAIQEQHAKMVADGSMDQEGKGCDIESGSSVVPALRNPYPSLITSHFVGWNHKKGSPVVGSTIAPSISSTASPSDVPPLPPPVRTGGIPPSSSTSAPTTREGNPSSSPCSSSPLPPSSAIHAAAHCFSAPPIKREVHVAHPVQKTEAAAASSMGKYAWKPMTALPSLPLTAAAVATEMEKANPSIADSLLTGVSVVGHGRWDGKIPVRGPGRSHHVTSDSVSGTKCSASRALESNAVRVPCPPPREYSAITRALEAETASKKVVVPGPPVRKELHDHFLEKHNHSTNELDTLMNEVLDPSKTKNVCLNTLSLFA